MRDKLHAPGRQHLKGVNLEREIGDVRGQRKFQQKPGPEMGVRQEGFGVAGINKDRTEDETPDPDDDAPKIKWTRLHHRFIVCRVDGALRQISRCSLVK
jgi:hypothetical protein